MSLLAGTSYAFTMSIYSWANFLTLGAVYLSKALLSDDLPIDVAALQARETKHLLTPTREADPGVDPRHDQSLASVAVEPLPGPVEPDVELEHHPSGQLGLLPGELRVSTRGRDRLLK